MGNVRSWLKWSGLGTWGAARRIWYGRQVSASSFPLLASVAMGPEAYWWTLDIHKFSLATGELVG